jgi:hypothetical protein
MTYSLLYKLNMVSVTSLHVGLGWGHIVIIKIVEIACMERRVVPDVYHIEYGMFSHCGYQGDIMIQKGLV